MMYFDIHTHQFTKHSIHNWMPGESLPEQKCSVGLHPWKVVEKHWKEVRSLAENDNVVFIGETGLDYACEVDRGLQLQFFLKHIELARKLKKPLILHCVRAYSDCLKELKDFSLPVIFHDYNGGEEETKRLLQFPNIYLSLGATLYRENSKVITHLGKIPLERIFFETDDSERSIEEVYGQYGQLSALSLNTISAQVLKNLNKLNLI